MIKEILSNPVISTLDGRHSKSTFDLNLGSTNLTSVYSPGNYSIIGDSSNTIKAEINTEGRTESFSAVAFSTNFSNLVMTDSSVITIYGVDKKIVSNWI